MKIVLLLTMGVAAILTFGYFFSGVIIKTLGILILNIFSSDIFITLLNKGIGVLSILAMD